jgi:transposase
MDSARFQMEKQLQEICEKTGAGLLFMPPYSPDFNRKKMGGHEMRVT